LSLVNIFSKRAAKKTTGRVRFNPLVEIVEFGLEDAPTHSATILEADLATCEIPNPYDKHLNTYFSNYGV